MRATRSASCSRPETVISFPRTRMRQSNADSINFRKTSR